MPNLQIAYDWAVRTCNDPNVGYSQAYRMGVKKDGITYYDCSSFIWFALLAGGWDCVKANGGSTWAWTTSTMQKPLKLLGFKELPTTQPWQKGDILLRPGHTEMAYDENRTMGAHSGKVALETQVSINANPSKASDWSWLYRWTQDAKNEWIKGNRYLSQAEMENNAYIIFNSLEGQGWTRNAIAGLLGNMQKESTVNPGIWQNLTPPHWNDDDPPKWIDSGWGLVQWTPDTKFTDWASRYGYADDDGDAQLIWINTMTVQSHEWIPTGRYPMEFADFKKSVETPEYLAQVYMYNFERPKSLNQPERSTYARNWFDWYGKMPVPPPTPVPEPDWKRPLPIWMYSTMWKRPGG